MSVAEIRDVIGVRDGGAAPCAHVLQLIQQHGQTFGRVSANSNNSNTIWRFLPNGVRPSIQPSVILKGSGESSR